MFIKDKSFYRAKMSVLVANIIRERRAQGLTQYQLSARLGMSPGNMCKLESGYHSMTLTTFLRICDALETKPEKLVKGLL